jgi:hypothetical protein
MYQLVQKINANCIFNETELPIYIKYFMFNTCPNIKIANKDLINLMEDFKYFKETRNAEINRSVIDNDITETKKNIKKINKELKVKPIVGNMPVLKRDLVKENTLKETLIELQERLKTLKNIDLENTRITGGAVTFNPKVEYVPNTSQPNTGQPIIIQPNTGQPNASQYYLIQNPNQRIFNQSNDQNKLKDQKSKMSFYINIELDLYPGKNVNALQKSVVKCQSTFEKIREAWAEIFGYQYRPLPMTETYSNNKEDEDKDKNKDKIKDIKDNNIEDNKYKYKNV